MQIRMARKQQANKHIGKMKDRGKQRLRNFARVCTSVAPKQSSPKLPKWSLLFLERAPRAKMRLLLPWILPARHLVYCWILGVPTNHDLAALIRSFFRDAAG
jgi:hypothetical protein